MTLSRVIGGVKYQYASSTGALPAALEPPLAPVPLWSAFDQSILGSWSAVPKAVAYGVYLDGVKQGGDTPNRFTTFSGLTSGTSYTVGVDAVSVSGHRSAIVQRQISTNTELPPPSGSESYWTDVFPVVGGWQLDPSQPLRVGVSPHVSLQNATNNTISTPGTISNKRFVGKVTVLTNGVIFKSCTFTANGYVKNASCGTSLNALDCGTFDVKAIDCEFYGGSEISVIGGAYYLRCRISEGNDILRIKSQPIELVECVLDQCLRKDSKSHNDLIQATNNVGNAATVFSITVRRCWVDAYHYALGIYNNAAFQSGGYGAGSGVSGWWEDTYVNGGNITMRLSAGNAGNGTFMRRCRFGKLNKFGAFNGNAQVSGQWRLDSSNVWADTLTPLVEGL